MAWRISADKLNAYRSQCSEGDNRYYNRRGDVRRMSADNFAQMFGNCGRYQYDDRTDDYIFWSSGGYLDNIGGREE